MVVFHVSTFILQLYDGVPSGVFKGSASPELLQCWEQGDAAAGGVVVHPDQDGGGFAALDGAFGAEFAGLVGAGDVDADVFRADGEGFCLPQLQRTGGKVDGMPGAFGGEDAVFHQRAAVDKDSVETAPCGQIAASTPTGSREKTMIRVRTRQKIRFFIGEVSFFLKCLMYYIL